MMIRTSEAVQSDATTWPLGHSGMYLQQSIGQSIYRKYGKATPIQGQIRSQSFVILYCIELKFNSSS